MPKVSQKSRGRDKEPEVNTQASQASRQRKQAMEVDDDDDDDYDHTQSQQTQGKNALSQTEMERKVSDLVRYMLFMDAKKIPVKRADLTKNLMKEHSRSLPAVLTEAKKKMKKIFGFEFIEAVYHKQKVYFLINTIPPEQQEVIESTPEVSAKLGLLLVILGIVFMNDDDLREELLWQTLKKLGIFKGRVHQVFGDVEKLISVEFVKQMYLDRKKIVVGDTATYHYIWGVRSYYEISKRSVLQMVSNVYGTSIETWNEKYREVVELKNKRTGEES